MQPEPFDAWAAVLQRRAAGEHASADVPASVRADSQYRAARRSSASGASSGGVVVLPLYGVVTQRGNALDDVSGSGSVSTQLFSRALRDAIADDSVRAIIIDTDSPGGSVYGVSELSDEIFQARTKKPIIPFANSLMASAAYWLGASATEIHVTHLGARSAASAASLRMRIGRASTKREASARPTSPPESSRPKATATSRSQVTHALTFNRALMTTTGSSRERLLAVVACRSPLSAAMHGAAVACSAQRRRSMRRWSTA
jgi:hypothetical protein